MSSLQLATGRMMPLMGLGTWQIPKDQCEQLVFEAIQSGYRLIDAACDYGNEVEVGLGIKKAIQAGFVTREELFVTSKLWNTYHREEHVRKACEKSLSDLGLTYLDLYLIHFPISQKFVPFEERYPPEWIFDLKNPSVVEDPVPYQETWKAMEALVFLGLVKDIGVCNIGTAMIREVLSYAKVPLSVLQIELHPHNTQELLLRFCNDKKIQVTAFSSFGGTNTAYSQDTESCLLNNPVIVGIAARYSASEAQILLRWAVQRGSAVIPKSSKIERIKSNADIFNSFELSAEDMNSISALNKNKRYNDPGAFCEKAFGTFFPIYE